MPVIVAPPGFAVTVQLLVGKLLKATLPVATLHVGGVIAPMVGAGEVVGCEFTTALADTADTQLTELVTVNV